MKRRTRWSRRSRRQPPCPAIWSCKCSCCCPSGRLSRWTSRSDAWVDRYPRCCCCCCCHSCFWQRWPRTLVEQIVATQRSARRCRWCASRWLSYCVARCCCCSAQCCCHMATWSDSRQTRVDRTRGCRDVWRPSWRCKASACWRSCARPGPSFRDGCCRDGGWCKR